MSLHVWELRKALENADDNEEVVITHDSMHITAVSKARLDWFHSGDGARSRGIVITLEEAVPMIKTCPSCCEKWEDDDDY